MEYRFLELNEWETAISLSYRVFLEFDAPYFPPSGVDRFRAFICNENLKKLFVSGSFVVVGAYDGDDMVGVIALRDNNHISLLFVDKRYHRQGIGRELVKELSYYSNKKLMQDTITVNSSPYAVDFYHKLGFKDISEEINEEGIIFTPMKMDLGV